MQEHEALISYKKDIDEKADFWQSEVDKDSEKIWWLTPSLHGIWVAAVLGIIALTPGIIFDLFGLQFLGVVLILAALIGAFIIIIAFSGESKAREQYKDLKKAKRSLAKFLKLQAEFDKHSLNPTQYKYALPNLIASYRRRADGYRNWYVYTQIAIIVLSATVTSLAGGWLDRYIALPWTVPVLSGIVSILTSATLFFKLREKSANLQQTADEIDLEYTACSLGIGDYKGMDEKDALTLLITRAQALREEQQKRQQQLEQSSHAEQKALQTEKR